MNLNTASAEELMTLSRRRRGEGAGDSWTTGRSTAGFQKPEDLMEIPGIKEGRFSEESRIRSEYSRIE